MEKTLSHYGILGMHWGIRRYQLKDGTRTALGKKRERLGITGPTSSGSSSGGTDYYEPNYTWRFVKNNPKKGPHVNDFWSKKASNGEKTESPNNEKTDKAKNENEEKKFSKEDIDKSVDKGKEATKKMDKKISEMTNEELMAANQRANLEKKYKDSHPSEEKKAYDKLQGNLSDAQSLANNSATLARNMKTLSNNSNKKSYIKSKDIDKMSNEELRSATERAKVVNDYLRETNQTTQRGRNSVDWDKLATVASVVGTGLAIASTISSLKNRNRNE